MKQKIDSWKDVGIDTILYRLPMDVSTDFTKVIISFADQLEDSLNIQWKVIGLSTSQKRTGVNATPIERYFTVAKSDEYSPSVTFKVFVRNHIDKAMKYKNEYFTFGKDDDKFAEDEYGCIYTYDVNEYIRLAKAMSFEYERFLREEIKQTKKVLSKCFKQAKRNI